jgi:hypothetical protein
MSESKPLCRQSESIKVVPSLLSKSKETCFSLH